MTIVPVATPSALRRRLIILEQSLDIIEFDLRALRVGETAAQFFQDPAHPLHVYLAGDLHGIIVGVFVAVQRPSERIVQIAVALLAAHAVTRAVALSVALALLHRLCERLRALAQRVQRLALRIHGTIGVTFAELASGIAHRGVRLAEPVFIALLVALLAALLTLLALFALLAFLPLLALLAFLTALGLLAHAALGKLLLQFLQPVAQALLILLQIAHALIVALLAAHVIAPRILALLIGLVAQLLLLADHVAELVQRLLHVVVTGLAGLRHLQVFKHFLQLFEQLLGGLLVAGA